MRNVSSGMMDCEAIQVLRSIDSDGKKKIKTIRQCRKSSPCLDDVLTSDNVKDLPIYVFSIAGKTRGGKSFLLNLMIQYFESLDNKGNGDWQNGRVPNCFTWKNGIDSITHGLWIYPKIFRLKNCFDDEIGVMLMDMEGLYDGEATDGEIIAISGISAAISYKQMFNIKDKITGDYLESVYRTLIKGIEELDSEEKDKLKDDYKLMFVVRDWIGEDTHDFGLDGGKEYIEKESERGTNEHQELWKLIRKTFREVECVLLPHPGLIVTKPQFNKCGDLGMLEPDFLKTVKDFMKDLFNPDNLYPPSTHLTGQDIYRILTSIDGKLADDELSFLNIFTEHANLIKVEKWKSTFEEQVANVKYSELHELNLHELKSKMLNIISKAERLLTGNSRTAYLDELTEALQRAFNRKAVEIFFQRYETSFAYQSHNIEKIHSGIWPDEKLSLFSHLSGDNTTRENAYVIFVKKSAGHFYNLLHKEHKRRFQFQCSLKKTLEECAGLDEKEIKSFKQCEDFSNGLSDKEVVYPLWLKEYQGLKSDFTDILLEKIGNLTGMEVEVLKKLRTKQYEHFESFTLLNKDEFNMDSIPASSKILLGKKVGYGVFGLPKHPQHISQLPTFASTLSAAASNISRFTSSVASTHGAITGARPGRENASTGYSREQESKIWPVVNKIINLSPNDIVKLSCTFLVYHELKSSESLESNSESSEPEPKPESSEPKPESSEPKPESSESTESTSESKSESIKNINVISVPIFRVKASTGIIYLDSNCRVYNNFNDFLRNNTLPDVVYCYPLNGWYNKAKGFHVAFSSTPASKTTTKALNTGDTVGKCVTFVAGGAGIAVLCGVAAPFVAATAIVGGIAGGAYGAVRGVQKIMDKKGHSEPVKFKDYFNVAANCLSVVGAAGMAVGRTMAVTAEGAAIILGTRAAAGVSGVNSLAAFFTSTNDTPELINLITEIEDSFLRMLFYFGTANSKDTLSLIRKSLKLEGNKNTVETLIALLENNCIQFASGSGEVRFEKYVSQSTAELVTSILTTISPDVRDVVKHYCDFLSLVQSFKGKMIRKEKIAEEVGRIMTKLLEKLNEEREFSKAQLINILCQNKEMLNGILLRKILDSMEQKIGEEVYIVLAFRFLVWSLFSEIRKANNFFNNIKHEAITLKNHYLGDVRCHPLREISQLVKERVEQTESAVDFKVIDLNELEYFVLELLKLLEENSKENWSVHQFARCVNDMNKDMVERFRQIVRGHKTIVDRKEKITCSDLETLTEELGLEGYNYGSWVSKKVMSALEVDVNAIENMAIGRQKISNLLITPAWGGVLDDLYHYHTKPQGVNQFNLIKQFKDVAEENYSTTELDDSMSIFIPCDEDLDLPTVFVFSYKDQQSKSEEGFIWLNRKKQRT